LFAEPRRLAGIILQNIEIVLQKSRIQWIDGGCVVWRGASKFEIFRSHSLFNFTSKIGI